MRLDTYADDTVTTDSALSMATNDCSFPQLQIVNDDQQFMWAFNTRTCRLSDSCQNGLSFPLSSDEIPDDIIDQWGLDDVGIDYHVVSAFGTRGCGKSEYTWNYSYRWQSHYSPLTAMDKITRHLVEPTFRNHIHREKSWRIRSWYQWDMDQQSSRQAGVGDGYSRIGWLWFRLQVDLVFDGQQLCAYFQPLGTSSWIECWRQYGFIATGLWIETANGPGNSVSRFSRLYL